MGQGHGINYVFKPVFSVRLWPYQKQCVSFRFNPLSVMYFKHVSVVPEISLSFDQCIWAFIYESLGTLWSSNILELSLLRWDKNILQYDHGSLMNMFRSLVNVYLECKNEELKKHVYSRNTMSYCVNDGKKNYVPFVYKSWLVQKHLSYRNWL